MEAVADTHRAALLSSKAMLRYQRVEIFRSQFPWPKPPLTQEEQFTGTMVLGIFNRMKEERDMDDVAVFVAAGFGNSYETFAAFRYGPHTCPKKILDYCRAILDPTTPELENALPESV